MRLFVEQMVLKSPRVWLTSITAKTTAWASWCSFNERCLSEDHICKLLYKITIFHDFIKQSLFWNGWGVVPISAAQNRYLFELKWSRGNNLKHMTGAFPFFFFFELLSFALTGSFVFVHNMLNKFKKINGEIWASKWISALAWVN